MMRSRRHCPLVCFLLTWAWCASSFAGRDGAELDRHLRLLDRAAAVRVSADFDAVPIGTIIEGWRDEFDLPIVLDHHAVAHGFLRWDDKITLSLRETPLLRALEMLAGIVNLGGQISDVSVDAYGGMLRLSAERQGAAMRFVRGYDVRDLLGRAESLERIARENSERAEAFFAQGDPARAMVQLIEDMVDPDGWLHVGGTRARLHEAQGVFHVTAPATTHWKMRALLAEWRRSEGLVLAFDAAMLSMPRDAFEALRQAHSGGSDEFLEALQREGRVRFRTTGSVSEGGAWRVSQETEARRLNIAFSPRFDVEQGGLACMVGAQIVASTGSFSVDTDVMLRPDEHVIVVELAEQGREVVLLVIALDRSS